MGVADRSAGIADNLALGLNGLVVRYQFKSTKLSATFTIETLLTHADGLLKLWSVPGRACERLM